MAKHINQVLSADGNTISVLWAGGEGTYSASGTFGGGTTRLMVSMDDGATFFSAGPEGELTISGIRSFSIPECTLRVSLTGATSPNLTISLDSVK